MTLLRLALQKDMAVQIRNRDALSPLLRVVSTAFCPRVREKDFAKVEAIERVLGCALNVAVGLGRWER